MSKNRTVVEKVTVIVFCSDSVANILSLIIYKGIRSRDTFVGGPPTDTESIKAEGGYINMEVFLMG
jgi:hypothetical protein